MSKVDKYNLEWGTYGKKGNLPMRKVYLHERLVSHLRAILRNQPHMSKKYRICIEELIEEKLLAISKRLGYSIKDAEKFGLIR